MEIGILNDVGPTSPPPFTPVGGVRLASSTAVAAGPEDKLLVNRPFHVRGGNRLFAQITDSAAFAGEVFLEALLYRLFPGEYVPATPFG